MYNKLPISKARPELKSQDYAFLREAGLAHIEKLASRIWTDYNAHDPGITLMELLAYAITDIGYRASLPIADILAPHPDDPDEKAFHTAREVLTCNPVTPHDFRKLLIDVDGVRNAWVIPTKIDTPPIYLDCPAETLSYSATNDNGDANVSLPLRGLYNVMLELEEEEGFDDLNSSTLSMEDLEVSFTDSKGDTYTFEVSLWAEFKPWDEIRDFESIQRSLIELVIEYPDEVGPYELNLNVVVNELSPLFQDPITLEVIVRDTTYVERPTVEELEEEVTEALANYIGLEAVPAEGTLLYRYQQKIARVREVVEAARDRMLAHRNLCEDVAAFKSLLVEEIGICADVELRPEANSEDVLEEIFYQIANFLSPTINFYSLSEMLDKGYTSEQIFDGPVLEFGFIDDEELALADRRRVIHVSDLIQIIMDVEGVVAVRSITIANFPVYNPGNRIDEVTAEWCLSLAFDEDYVPRLTTRRSTINFFKDDLPIF